MPSLAHGSARKRAWLRRLAAKGRRSTNWPELAQVIVTPRAQRDVNEAIAALTLPDDAWTRIGRSLRALETFPLAGPELAGRWTPTRFVLGPWSWMILLYRYEESSDRVYVVAMHDGRSAASATAVRR
jgi:plasmid stabilization system protein ParE